MGKILLMGALVISTVGVILNKTPSGKTATYYFNTDSSGAIVSYAGTSLPAGCPESPTWRYCAKEFQPVDVEPVMYVYPMKYRVKPGHEEEYIQSYMKPQADGGESWLAKR